ncbi:hypothetical protein [Marinagarivorans cellulosilyticus]|uniref:Uncharacterized protein n=1 Tax=Marinagarivorans cellulosilyticus TaxID=2721545 RepID=A0AAN1WLK7_9GAMM|nr:hypothetical protein [Marinagarivorans cellulosilyticus]BCD99839.1 hypothetical protein MARGE09_P4041 [Marinagarivorans cellulosilyticus]
MGIGRRAFLQAFGASIASLGNPLQAVVLSDDLYINRALGIAFHKPPGWHFASVREFSELRHEQILKDDELSEQLRDAGEPLVVISKLDPAQQALTPAITVWVEPADLGDGEALIECIPYIERTYQRVLNHYRVIGKPITQTQSNCESVQFFAEFLFEQTSMSAMARNRCLVSIRETQMFTINMFDYPTLNQSTQQEYDGFLNSLYYV